MPWEVILLNGPFFLKNNSHADHRSHHVRACFNNDKIWEEIATVSLTQTPGPALAVRE